jgi:hypothetical protein
VSFAAANADNGPHRALPQKPQLESLNLDSTYIGDEGKSFFAGKIDLWVHGDRSILMLFTLN